MIAAGAVAEMTRNVPTVAAVFHSSRDMPEEPPLTLRRFDGSPGGPLRLTYGMGLAVRRGNFMALSPNKLWLCIAAIASVPLLTGASTPIETTIPESVAPITIDRCVVKLEKMPSGSAFSDDVDFTNVSQRAAAEVRFRFEIVDAIGRTAGNLTDEKVGEFAPGIPVSQSTAAPTGSSQPQPISNIPASSKIVCMVQMVRFDDGSVWNEGDGPVGTGSMITPPPQASATPYWQFPFDRPTPP
jgi:hypothetical protein